MNQSVYKRDFRDPRDIARLWKFLLNENLKSKFEYNEENGRALGMVEELSIKRHHHDEGNGSELSNNCIGRAQSDMNVIKNQQDLRKPMKAKSVMFLPSSKEKEKVRNFLRFPWQILIFLLDRKN